MMGNTANAPARGGAPRKLHRIPLQPEERTRLDACEDALRNGLADFVQVGEALRVIAGRKLYRDTHRTFADYCGDRWGMKRRTAYQKIQAADAYDNVRSCAHIAPVNEFQVRQLLPLATPQLQQAAWQRAAAAHDTTSAQLTAAEVRKAVRELLAERGDDPLQARFTPDRTFPGIAYRWDLTTADTDADGNTQLYLAGLPARSVAPRGTGPPAEAFVLVGADTDISSDNVPDEFVRRICALLAEARDRRFLLCMDRPYRYNLGGLPPHIEVVARVRRQADVDALEAHYSMGAQRRGIWCIPEERLYLPAIRIERVLISAPARPNGFEQRDIALMRQLVVSCLGRTTPVHIAAGANALFCL